MPTKKETIKKILGKIGMSEAKLAGLIDLTAPGLNYHMKKPDDIANSSVIGNDKKKIDLRNTISILQQRIADLEKRG